jgi:hypothetical protein
LWLFQFSIGSRLKVQIFLGSLICPKIDFQQHPQLVEIITPELLAGWESIFYGNISKLSTIFVLFMSPDSAPNLVRRILRDRRQSKSESVFKVFPLVYCVPMIITSPLFVRFEHMSNEWKVEKVSYKFGIGSFLRLYLD